MGVLGVAHGVEQRDEDEGGDGPASSAKLDAFRSDFAVGEAEERGQNERG